MTKRKKRRVNFNQSFIRYFGVFIVFSLVFLYIYQVTEMTKEIYLMQAYNREVQNIIEENRRSEYSFLKSSSMAEAEETVKDSNFTRVNGIHYISVSDYQIASR